MTLVDARLPASHEPVLAALTRVALSDRCLQLARAGACPVAVMPCCVQPRDPAAPAVLPRELGVKLAVDVDRTYRLTAAGYEVLWRYIPEEITPMNRILIGKRRRADA